MPASPPLHNTNLLVVFLTTTPSCLGDPAGNMRRTLAGRLPRLLASELQLGEALLPRVTAAAGSQGVQASAATIARGFRSAPACQSSLAEALR